MAYHQVQLQHWYLTGLEFGYPTCCVQAFINLSHVCDSEPRKLNGSGYIPCLVCNQKSEQELIDAINANRKHPTPFEV